MRRIRWYDPDSDAPFATEWRYAALMIATLFLNVYFWAAAADFWMSWPLLPFAGISAIAAWGIAALFFFGPAWATQRAKQPLLKAMEDSLGSIPAILLRGCSVVFLVVWIASVLAFPALWWVQVVFWPNLPTSAAGMIVVAIAALVFLTGIQSVRTGGSLALFTNKLGVALIIAALIRVRYGLPAALNGFPLEDIWRWPQLWRAMSRLVWYARPLAFLAANFGWRCQNRRQATAIGLAGLVAPLFATLLLGGLIAVVSPGPNPSILTALWWRDVARSGLPPRMMLGAITILGAMRFGAKALTDYLPMLPGTNRRWWIWLTGVIAAIAWLGLNPSPTLNTMLDESATILTSAAAVLTADFFTKSHSQERAARVDWVGSAALLAGIATQPCWLLATQDAGLASFTHSWLLPCYGVAALVCVVGRLATRQK